MTSRWVAMAAILACAAGAGAQLVSGPPKDGEKRELKLYPALNTLMIWTCTFTEEPGDFKIPIFNCVRECEGKKHPKHEACDLSCDKKCPAEGFQEPNRHEGYAYPEATELGAKDGPPTRPHSDTLNDAFRKFGLPGIASGRSFTKNPFGSTSYVYHVAQHWNETPCSSSTMYIPAKSFIVTVEYDIHEVVPVDDGRGGTRIIAQGPKGTLRWRALFPIKGATTIGEPVVNCRCEVVQEEPKEHGFIPGNLRGGEYAYIEQGGKRRPLTGSDLPGLVSSIVCEDMNQAVVSFNTGFEGNLFIPAGWELECINGGGQDVQLVEDLMLAVPASGASVRVELGPLATSWTSGAWLRTLCLDIEKPEPDEQMKYRLMPPKNPFIAALARITRESNYRGPWDQARLWIATDQASYDQIGEVMRPMVGQGTYLREMFRAAEVGAISPFDARYAKIMELRFLFAENYEPEAVEWLLSSKLITDPEATIGWVKGQSAAVRKLFEQGDAGDDVELLGLLAYLLARDGGGPGAEAAIWLLTQATPEAHRSAAADSHGAGDMAMLLRITSDEKTASVILGWLERAKPPIAVLAALNANPELPAQLRQRAAAVAKSER